MKTNLTFIIPICHPANARNWSKLKTDLKMTIESLLAQDSSSWRAVIVANENADLPHVSDNIDIVRVNFPPNEKYDKSKYDIKIVQDHVRFDKGRRILAGILHVKNQTDYIMVVDCDDFVNCGIASFVEKNKGKNGWYSKDGYIWNEGSRFVLKYRDFSRLCGTSLIIRTDLYDLPSSIEAAETNYIKNMLGSHVIVQDILAQHGTPLAPLPFYGAVYRVGHIQSHSRSLSVLKTYLFNIHTIVKFPVFLKNLTKFRPMTSKLRGFFSLYSGMFLVFILSTYLSINY